MNTGETGAEVTWSARRVRPTVALYVLGVFGAFVAPAHFVFHSPGAVKALFMAAVASIASLAPTILRKVEYRATEAGLARRHLSGKRPQEFEDIFSWNELSHLVPTRLGFKYFKKLAEPNPIVRFLRHHVSGGHSGEIHAEPRDLERIRTMLRERGVRIAGPSESSGSNQPYQR